MIFIGIIIIIMSRAMLHNSISWYSMYKYRVCVGSYFAFVTTPNSCILTSIHIAFA